jgi:serine phosphatase RsbU (regulator of sigma subunit)
LDASGTVKFGDFSAVSSGTWKPVVRKGAFLPFNTIILAAVMLFLAAMAVFSMVRIPTVVAEGKNLERTVIALIAGKTLSPEEKRKRIAVMKKRGMGLRVKFSVLVTSLIFAVVLLVSIPLGTFMIETQQQNLAQGLRKQAEVLLESLAAGARTYLPLQRTLELRLLPNQRSAMTDSLFVTITGEGSQDPTRFEYVWASDDPSILEKIDGDALIPGLSYLEDEVTPEIETLKNEIDAAASAAVSGIVAEMERLNEQTRPLVSRLIRGEDPETRAALSALQDEIQSLEIELTNRLNEVGSAIHTIPEFSVENFDLTTEAYLFFKPIVYRSSQKGVYYNGMVRLGVSTKSIIGQIEAARKGLIIRTGLIAFLAIIIGIGGSLILATIIIIPIKVLVRGVERIRDTQDKEELHDHEIAVKTRDEISELAETINQMTHGLVLAAKASKELTVGKEVQKMFIPLETDAGGKKLSTGHQESADFEFFGYYEGAKGVSGDYFDFKKLDENHYAVMKCDVAGKGVSASLIMVQVATLFINYFNSWQLKKDGLNLQKLVYTINDLVEERKFTGRFAAFTMGILNVKTGEATLCNAGDKLVHIYDASKGEMLVKELPAAPAVGVFPSFMVEMKSGFTQVRQVLDHGDTLFLFTDGIEEAKRNFRDSSFKQIVCDEPGIPENGLHGNHQKGAGNEEMGMDRIHGIVEAVFKKGSFELSKYHNPVPGEILSFDFSSCAGTAKDAVLALIAVEKVFRIYRDPKASSQDRVSVDRKVDQFLKDHFLRYADFFANPVEDPRNKEYVYFPGLKEDEQYDDLTILAIRKK